MDGPRSKGRGREIVIEVGPVMEYVGILAIVALGLIVVVWWVRSHGPAGDSGGESSSEAGAGDTSRQPADGPWRVALVSGDGNDWVRLSEADKTTLCRKAASDLGKDDRHARAYRDFLETFYRRPDPNSRRWRIAETIGVCQVSIDNATIRLE